MTARANIPTWTPAQQQAIEHLDGDLLVSAAAGSGKTAVLAERCARLIAQRHCTVDGLLVLTFTEAAANEMRTRIASAIREKLAARTAGPEETRALEKQAAMVERASISTLHAFCARILRQYFHEAGIDPAFELVDEEEAGLLRDETLCEILAKWHRGTSSGISAEKAEAFARFHETVADGRDDAVMGMIQTVYRMLASSADPAAWKQMALAAYSPEGCAATLDRFARDTVAPRLNNLRGAADGAQAVVAKAIGEGPMLTTLQKFADRVRTLMEMLRLDGMKSWDAMRADAAGWDWGRLKTINEISDFENLKKRTWEALKTSWNKFRADFLIEDAAALRTALVSVEPHVRTLLELVDDFSQTYAAAKRDQNRLDFSDLERFALDLLTNPNATAARELQNRYRHILVDEFQDINPLQAALLAAVRSTRHSPRGNLFVVGDVKQSIYAFRLAEPDLFLAREAQAKAADPATQQYVALAHNFRSQPDLLAAMNELFAKILTSSVAKIPYRDGHELCGGARQAAAPPSSDPMLRPFTGAPLEVHIVAMDAVENAPEDSDDNEPENPDDAAGETLSTIEAEATVVAARLKSLLAEKRGVQRKDGSLTALEPRDIAILLRSMRHKALLFARALAAAGIPVHADLSTGYFDAPEVQEVLALLHILDNPLQDIHLTTVLLGPYGRFSFDDLAALRLAYDRKTIPFAQAVSRHAEEIPRPDGVGVSEYGGIGVTHPDTPTLPHSDTTHLRARLSAFFATLARWRAWTRVRPLHDALGAIYAETHIVPYLSGLEAGAQRVANLQMLHQRALQFAGFRKQGLHRFLRFIERLREQERDFGEAPVLSEASNVVRIMSVHKSKGLEFPVVAVSGLGGRFNLLGKGPVAVHRHLGIGMKFADLERNAVFPTAASLAIADAEERSDRAEEMRLLYVAMTRARDHLLLTGTLKKRDKLEEIRADWSAPRSPNELPEELLLKGWTYFDWLLPALSMPGLRVAWPDDPPLNLPQVVITTHAPALRQRPAKSPRTADDALVQKLRAGAPLQLPTNSAAAETLALRLTTPYAFAAFARLPAVLSVSELKRQAHFSPEDADATTASPLPQSKRAPLSATPGLAARARGIATHRLLELYNFAAGDSPTALAGEIQRLLDEKTLASSQAEVIDRDAVLWFLATPLGRELVAAARTRPQDLRREIPFVWLCPDLAPPLTPTPPHPDTPTLVPSAPDPLDQPTVRGVIDLLLAAPPSAPARARIIDYKTDSLQTWQFHLPEYQAQMRYYLRAARDILGLPVEEAILVFLSPRHLETVTLE